MDMQTVCPTIHVQSLTNYANKQADNQTEISAPDLGLPYRNNPWTCMNVLAVRFIWMLIITLVV